MVSVLQNTKLMLPRSTLRSFSKITPCANCHRSFSISYTVRQENGDNKAEEARKKLQQLLRETRSNRNLNKKGTPDEKLSSRKVDLAKPRLSKFKDKNQIENVKGLDPQMVYAAHRVAVTLDNDEDDDTDEYEDKRQLKVRKVESDLLKKLKSVHNETEEAKIKGEAAAHNDLKSLFSSLQVVLLCHN